MEHDPETIWQDTVAVCREALARSGLDAREIAALGITNQRETVVLWERATGKPVYRAIVWQDRRTAERCRELSAAGHDALVRERTGLLIDPYFSATKLAWLLDEVAGARQAAERGELAFGTVDLFLLWRLSGGAVHATDASNAARTMLYDIHRQDWDADLLRLLGIPRAILPEVKDCSTLFGATSKALFGAPLPITGIAGDQQAATVGQACFRPGMLKSTYGTGCFALLNTGDAPVVSRHRLLTTIAYRLNGKTTYALEGSIFVAGAAVQWLRDGLKLISQAGDSEPLAAGIYDTGGVYLVPAFVGLGAPHWDPDARAAILGLTRDSGIPQIVRAALESVGYQTRDLMMAMAADLGDDLGQDDGGRAPCASTAGWSRTTGSASSSPTSSICRSSGRRSPRRRRWAPRFWPGSRSGSILARRARQHVALPAPLRAGHGAGRARTPVWRLAERGSPGPGGHLSRPAEAHRC